MQCTLCIYRPQSISRVGRPDRWSWLIASGFVQRFKLPKSRRFSQSPDNFLASRRHPCRDICKSRIIDKNDFYLVNFIVAAGTKCDSSTKRASDNYCLTLVSLKSLYERAASASHNDGSCQLPRRCPVNRLLLLPRSALNWFSLKVIVYFCIFVSTLCPLSYWSWKKLGKVR